MSLLCHLGFHKFPEQECVCIRCKTEIHKIWKTEEWRDEFGTDSKWRSWYDYSQRAYEIT